MTKDKAQFFVGGFGIIFDEQGRVLLVHRTDYDLWNLPGGALEAGETPWEGAIREIKEEIGVTIKNIKFFGEFSSPSFYSQTFTINRIYLGEINNNPTPQNEIEDIIWLSKEDFINKKFPMIPLIKKEIIPAIISAGYF